MEKILAPIASVGHATEYLFAKGAYIVSIIMLLRGK